MQIHNKLFLRLEFKPSNRDLPLTGLETSRVLRRLVMLPGSDRVLHASLRPSVSKYDFPVLLLPIVDFCPTNATLVTVIKTWCFIPSEARAT